MNLQDLKNAVISLLISDYEFLLEDAGATVDESMVDCPSMWNENAEPKDLANLLASDENDE